MKIQFSEIWRLLNLGLVVDWQKQLGTLRLGPVKISKVPLPTLKSLSTRPAIIEPILSDLFVTARVMWEREESPQAVQIKLEQLDKSAERLAVRFHSSSKKDDHILGSALRGWSNTCKIGAKDLKTAIEMENDPIDTDMDTSAMPAMKLTLQKVRIDVYPTVEFLITLLPEDNLIRQQALQKLLLGERNFEHICMLSSSEIPKATIEITKAGDRGRKRKVVGKIRARPNLA